MILLNTKCDNSLIISFQKEVKEKMAVASTENYSVLKLSEEFRALDDSLKQLSQLDKGSIVLVERPDNGRGYSIYEIGRKSMVNGHFEHMDGGMGLPVGNHWRIYPKGKMFVGQRSTLKITPQDTVITDLSKIESYIQNRIDLNYVKN